MPFALWMTIIIGAPILLLVVGFYFLNASAPESKYIKEVLDSEAQKLSKMDCMSLDALCQKEPKVEVEYNNTRYVRSLTADKLDKRNLVVRVTLTGMMSKNIEESKVITKTLPV